MCYKKLFFFAFLVAMKDEALKKNAINGKNFQ